MSSIPSESPHSTEGAKSKSEYTLKGYHVFLLLLTSTQDALLWKAFASFSGFIHVQYHFSYTSLTTALSIATLSTIFPLFVNPRITFIKTNILIFLIQTLQIVGLILLWLIKHNYITFIIGLSLLLNVFQFHWGISNAMMSAFITDNNNPASADRIRRQYLTIYNSNWTICTFLFIITGYIMRYYSYWLFLEIMLITSVCLAICNIIFLPKISINQQNELNHKTTVDTSLYTDLKILFVDNMIYTLLFGVIVLQFIVWGLLYVTFGPFIQYLFNLNAATFGIIFALIEGCGNCVAILLLYIFKTGKIVLFGGVIEVIAILLILLITNVDDFAFLLDVEYQYVMYFIIFLWFIGNECIIVGIMILNVQIAPSLQQARASGLITFGNSVCTFMSTLITGPLYYHDGMKVESIIILFIVAVEMVIIVWFYLSQSAKQSKQKIALMKNIQNDIKTYDAMN